jgi:uncharacterized protein (DUF1330 family)
MRSALKGCLVLLALGASPAWSDALGDYMALAVGEFSSAIHAQNDARYAPITWQIAEIWQGDANEARWLYTESWMDGAETPYMQRISRITPRGDGTLLAERFTIPEANRFISAWSEPGRFAALSSDDLVPLRGCDAVFVRTGENRFEGSTQGNLCRNDYKGASYVVSYNTLTANGMVNWDRGFDSEGKHLWGPQAGGYQFTRAGSDTSCSRPVRMLVYGEISDREKFLDYVNAIGDAGLYPKTGGYYEAVSPALVIFEGNPPANRGVVIVRFPCEQAARDFWFSDEYEAIKPIREGIAEFEVLLLPAPPIAPWVK